MLPKLDASLFDWLAWRNGTPADLIGSRHCRTSDLLRARMILLECAVGYCRGDSVPCRPKPETMAVMYFSENGHFWFHMSDYEFRVIFVKSPPTRADIG